MKRGAAAAARTMPSEAAITEKTVKCIQTAEESGSQHQCTTSGRRRRLTRGGARYLKANSAASGIFLPSTAAVMSLVANMEKVMPFPP